MVDLFFEHSAALGFYQVGLLKQAADLHFSGKLQVDSLGDLVLDVPSALLRGCLTAVKEPGVELHLGSNWKARIVVMSQQELSVIGGAKVVTERGKDFDYQIGQSSSSPSGEGRIWYLEISAPDLVKLRQSYGLSGQPEGGFRAIFGVRKPKLFQDGDKVRKDAPKPVEAPRSVSKGNGGYEWVLKKSAQTAVLIKGNPAHFPADGSANVFYQKVRNHLESRGYQVAEHAGDPHTDPPRADVWVGHSRGAGRFDFAPPGINLIPLGSHRPGAINHPNDRSFSGGAVTADHFSFDPSMAAALDSRLVQKRADLSPHVQLQPHQQALANEIDPEHPVKKLLMWGVGSGKCVRGNTLVPTDRGLIEISELFAHLDNGEQGWFMPDSIVRVVGHSNGDYGHKPVRRLYREVLSDSARSVLVRTHRGNSIETTKEHEFLVYRGLNLVWVKAGDLVEDDAIAMSGKLPTSEEASPHSDLVELIGWQVTEGYENPEEPGTSITQDDMSVLERLRRLFRSAFPNSTSGRIRNNGLHIWCREYRDRLESSGYFWGHKARYKQLPAWAFSLPSEDVSSLLRAIFDAEGSVSGSYVELSSASVRLAHQVQYLLLQLGVRSSCHYKKGQATNGLNIPRLYWRLTISGDDIAVFQEKVGFSYQYKQKTLVEAAAKNRNTNFGVPFKHVYKRLVELGLDRSCLGSRSGGVDTVNTETAVSFISKVRSMLLPGGLASWEKFTKSDNPYYKVGRQCRQVIEAVNSNREELALLADSVEKVLMSGLRFERVEAIKLGSFGGYVYDIEVEADSYDEANYVAGVGGFIVHNSLGSIAASEAYGHPYTVIGPAAVRPTFKSEQKRFTDQSLPSSVISYQKAMQPGGVPHPDSLVVDEAQRIVNPGSQQSQAVTEAARRAKQVLLLSGTPIINRPGDIAPIMSILTDREISPAAFEGRYLGQQAKPRTWSEWLSGKDRKYEPILRHQDELKALLDGKVDWYAPSKPMVSTRHSDHEVDMSQDQARLYQAMFGKIPWKLRMGLDRTTDMSPAELQQLRSFLSGPRQVGLSDYPFASHGDPLKSFYGSTKLQAAYSKLKEKIDSDERTKAIVYSNFPRAGLEPYRAALMHNNIPHTLFDGSLSDAERDAAVRSFNEGRSRVALVGPAGAEGISLRGAQLLQQLDPHWNQARMDQSAARGIRFDSHTHLPEELQNIEVQRFISKLPPKSRSWLQAMRLSPYSDESQPAADDYLRDIAENKEKSNRLILDLLKEIGTRKP